jgi:hypothetical protein
MTALHIPTDMLQEEIEAKQIGLAAIISAKDLLRQISNSLKDDTSDDDKKDTL